MDKIGGSNAIYAISFWPGAVFRFIVFPVYPFPHIYNCKCHCRYRTFLDLIFDLDYPLHGFFHSFAGGSIIAIVLALLMVKWINISKAVWGLQTFAGVFIKKHLDSIVFGIYMHILFDSTLYGISNRSFYPILILFSIIVFFRI